MCFLREAPQHGFADVVVHRQFVLAEEPPFTDIVSVRWPPGMIQNFQGRVEQRRVIAGLAFQVESFFGIAND